SITAPSSRTYPREGRHTPTSARASVDLPEALGPMIPSALPAFTANATPCTAGFSDPGGVTLIVSTISACDGAGNCNFETSGGNTRNNADNRDQLCRATTKPFQLTIHMSTGARARPVRIELAMMIPAVASPRITRYAPMARTADCSIILSTRPLTPNPPV